MFHVHARDAAGNTSEFSDPVTLSGAVVDTEDTPEMRALENIEVAFLPMNLPYTMSVDQAAAAVTAFAPAVVYPYHHRGSDLDAFAALVAEGGSGTQVVVAPWYAEADA